MPPPGTSSVCMVYPPEVCHLSSGPLLGSGYFLGFLQRSVKSMTPLRSRLLPQIHKINNPTSQNVLNTGPFIHMGKDGRLCTRGHVCDAWVTASLSRKQHERLLPGGSPRSIFSRGAATKGRWTRTSLHSPAPKRF